MNVDERALKVLTDWNSRKYKNEGQRAASLQCLIISALKEQDRDTRHSCAEAIIWGVQGDSIHVDKAHDICINT